MWQKFHAQYWIVGTYNIIAVHERKDLIVINVAKILHYDCDSCGKSSTQLVNLNKHIMGIHARQRNYKCVSLNQQV